MRRFDVRMAFRLHRFEFIGFALLIGLLSLAAVVVAANLDATGYGANCNVSGAQANPSDAQGNPPACEAMGRAFYDIQNSQVAPVQSILIILPFLLGALVGASLVARELERGTTRLAWSLSPSRARWFVVRVVPAIVIVFGLSFLAGVALDRLMTAVEPGTDMANSFAGYGNRGVVLAARATFVFAIGVAVGAVMGRMLPALIVTAVIAYVGLAGGMAVHGRILASEAVLVDDATGSGLSGAMYFDQRIRMPDGRVVTWEELSLLVPPPEDGSTEWPPAGYTYVALVVPGERYRSVELREVAALAGGSLVALGIGAFMVRGRRPG
jgi:hypothetical protein